MTDTFDRAALCPNSQAGLWITLEYESARILVTRDAAGVATAILLDEWDELPAFSVVSFEAAPKAEFMGESLLEPCHIDEPSDDRPYGRLIIRDGNCHLTCVRGGQAVEVRVSEQAVDVGEDGDYGFKWELLFRYYHDFFAVAYEAFYPNLLWAWSKDEDTLAA